MVYEVDIWLDIPIRTYEASDTSGRKAEHKGVVNFSVLVGLWID